jgi:hypothetical protein
MMIPRRLREGDEAWFDKLTMTDNQPLACPEPVEGPTKVALELELELDFFQHCF